MGGGRGRETEGKRSQGSARLSVMASNLLLREKTDYAAAEKG